MQGGWGRRVWISLLWAAVAGGPLAAQVHESPFAGKWFPAGREELVEVLDRAFEAAEKRAGGVRARRQLRALIAPHAAIQYSGVVAASAYRLLDQPQNVIVLGFSHRKALEGVVAPRVEAYLTPLGSLAVSRGAIAELGFRSAEEGPLCDHSLESQLPLLQRVAPEATITPLYVGELSAQQLQAAAGRLAARMRKGDVIIASSDFTHYGKAYGYVPYPNDKQIRLRLFRQAMLAFEEIGSIRVAEFDEYLEASGDTICGQGPIRLLLAALARLEDEGEEIYMEPVDYMASGELTGDYSMSVGYGALAFYPASAFRIGPEDQRKLLASARGTLNRYLAERAHDGVKVPEAERSADLEQRSGVFVTVKKNGELRGCVGALVARKPLWETVPDRTLAAMTADPRFPPLVPGDGPVTLEISLLTPLKKVADWREFRLGKGALLLIEDKSATLLPQVAAETGWNREQFLENLARKAGLDGAAYRHPRARIYVFDAQVFAEPPEHADGNGRGPPE